MSRAIPISLLAPLLLLAAQPIDLGLITDRIGFELKPVGRTDLLRFEITAYPAIMTNTITFTLTNRVVKITDLPLPNGSGLMAVLTLWSDGSYSQPAIYTYDLFRGVTHGPVATPVGLLVPDEPDKKSVVERAVAFALRPPVVQLPPLPPMEEERAATPLPDAAPEGMRHYYQRARRDGSPAITNSPRSRIRRFR